MKKSLLVAVGAMAAMCGTAQAENWSGPYVGGAIGSNTRETEWTDLDGDWVTPGDIASDDDVDATSISAHVGYNWQFGNFVLGAQGGVSYMDLSETEVIFGDVAVDNSLSFAVDARLNAGYSFGAFLPYVTVGAALSDLEHSWAEEGDTSDSWADFSNDTALIYGAGMDYALSPQWSVGAEYLIYEFGSEVSTNPDSYRMDVETDVESLRLTVNYRLN
jgi:outer membrane immunogenic protein